MSIYLWKYPLAYQKKVNRWLDLRVPKERLEKSSLIKWPDTSQDPTARNWRWN